MFVTTSLLALPLLVGADEKPCASLTSLQVASPKDIVDTAFAALPEGTLETLLRPENKDQLTSILTDHVVAGNVLAADVIGLSGAVTVNGQQADIAVEKDREGAVTKVMVDGATVVMTDIRCSNGIIHVIDSVILPASDNLVEAAAGAESFGTLLAAAQAAGLAEVLAEQGPFTVFAPTDAAFAKLPEGTVESLLKPENEDQLVTILKHHVVAGRVYASDVLAGAPLTTLAGTELTARADDGGAFIDAAGIAATDIDASNGVIHVIDAVLLPRS